jgi:hypothetical protein
MVNGLMRKLATGKEIVNAVCVEISAGSYSQMF